MTPASLRSRATRAAASAIGAIGLLNALAATPAKAYENPPEPDTTEPLLPEPEPTENPNAGLAMSKQLPPPPANLNEKNELVLEDIRAQLDANTESDERLASGVVTYAAYVRTAGDEEWRQHYGSDWRNASELFIERADNPMFSKFGIDLRSLATSTGIRTIAKLRRAVFWRSSQMRYPSDTTTSSSALRRTSQSRDALTSVAITRSSAISLPLPTYGKSRSTRSPTSTTPPTATCQ